MCVYVCVCVCGVCVCLCVYVCVVSGVCIYVFCVCVCVCVCVYVHMCVCGGGRGRRGAGGLHWKENEGWEADQSRGLGGCIRGEAGGQWLSHSPTITSPASPPSCTSFGRGEQARLTHRGPCGFQGPMLHELVAIIFPVSGW